MEFVYRLLHNKLMARSNKIRNRGAIPERRHDAFLLALLLAFFLNVSFFAIQAILPRLVYLVQVLGPAAAQQPEEEMGLPFVLADSSWLDEEVDDTPADAESVINREARQVEATPTLPIDKPYVEEGVDEILTPPEGNPGPEESHMQSPEMRASEPHNQENDQGGDQSENQPDEAEASEAAPEEQTEANEPEDAADASESVETPSPVEPVAETPPEQLPEPPPEELPPPPEPVLEPPPPPEVPPEPIADVPPREPLPEPVEQLDEFIPPPPMEAEPLSDPLPEPPEEVLQPEPEPVAELVPEPLPPEVQPEPAPYFTELAAAPVTPDGWMDPQRQYLDDLALQRMMQQPPPQQPQWREEREYTQQPYQPAQPQPYQQPQPEQPRQRSREGRPQATFRRVGPGTPTDSRASTSGGAPRMRNVSSRINLLDADPNMKYLAHKYAAYMKEVAKLLQESLNREVLLQPMGYTTGQSKITFTIAPDGSLGYYNTLFPAEGELDYVRITSERTLVNAGPFPHPSPEMLADPIFQKMSLIVSLY